MKSPHFVLLCGMFLVGCPSDPGDSPPLSSPSPADAGIRVVEVQGTLEARGDAGEWVDVPAGTTLRKDAVLRTGESGSAVVDLGDTATITLAPRSEADIEDVTKALANVRVTEGRLSAVVHGGGESKLRVRVKNSDAVAETASGEFSVLTDGAGQVTVASKRGDVAVSSSGQSVSVSPGFQSFVQAKSAPSTPKAIPSSLLLKVGKPKSLQNRRQTTVSGRSSPGAVVSVNGQRVRTDREGKFSARVALREGRNEITVSAEDASGLRKVQNLPPVTLDVKPPNVETKVDWD